MPGIWGIWRVDSQPSKPMGDWMGFWMNLRLGGLSRCLGQGMLETPSLRGLISKLGTSMMRFGKETWCRENLIPNSKTNYQIIEWWNMRKQHGFSLCKHACERCDLCLDVGAAPPAPLQDRPVKPPSKSLDPLVSFETIAFQELNEPMWRACQQNLLAPSLSCLW